MLFRRCYDYSAISCITCLLLTSQPSPSLAHLRSTTSQFRGNTTSTTSPSTEYPILLSCGSHLSSSNDGADLIDYINSSERELQSFEPTTIPVCFHILSNDRGKNSLSSEQIQAQLDILNRAYSSASCCDTSMEWCDAKSCSVETGFRFAWAQLDATRKNVIPAATVLQYIDHGACIVTHNIPRWIRFFDFWDPRLRLMKRKLRIGDATTLNVYWTDFWTMNIAGYSTFPHTYWRKPRLDGVVMRVGVSVGGSITPYAQGAMLAHEVGHWLGLYHTFEQGCAARSDKVDDTPREREAFRGCGQLDGFPLNRDSCPDDEGHDPVHNFMDYAYDECKFEFTQGQVARMQASYERYRKGKGSGR